MKKFYITTAIDYPSARPHLGHAYEKTVSDSLARWHRLLGEEVFFSTGTDEHGLKIQRKARQAKKTPREFVDEMSAEFKKLCAEWDISFDRFIRTTDPDHEEVSRKIFQKVFDKGDIYLGEYEGLYCADCEQYYLEKDLVNGNCPVHGTKAELVREPSYFFRMSKYQKQLLDFFEKNPGFILPRARKAEIVNRVKEGLRDLSVSRTSFSWGIALPNDPKHFLYVWFDALINYVSAVDYPKGNFKKFWPADVHVIGTDISWFHCVIWPCMLFSAGIEPPKSVFIHGFIKLPSGKMSKSKGNVVDPLDLSTRFGSDSVRYFLLRDIPFGEDGVFEERLIVERHNSELANELGNLLNRVLVLIEKNCNGEIPQATTDSALAVKLNLKKIQTNMERFETHLALAEIMNFVKACNAYINEKEPWKLTGKQQKVLYSAADSLRMAAILLSPFVPRAAGKMLEQLGAGPFGKNDLQFNKLKAGTKTKRGEVLFKKTEK
ncbi:MAG: methionine--tRNA ligase [Candidatus Diapherotrites archaeon]|nr:methionine--tRNA ligase [Candidatus Diapherotrites archaeon]